MTSSPGDGWNASERFFLDKHKEFSAKAKELGVVPVVGENRRGVAQFIVRGPGSHLRWPKSYAEGVGPPPAEKRSRASDDGERPL
jgi:hypothetical protein